MTIIAPPSNAPQVHGAPSVESVTVSSLDPMDERIRREVHGSEPIRIWTLLNRLAEEKAPPSRHELRRRKLELWQQVNRLLRRKLLFRAGRHAVTTTKPSGSSHTSDQPTKRRGKRTSVVLRAGRSAGSTVTGTRRLEGDNSIEEPGNQITTVQCQNCDTNLAAKSAVPLSPEERANAARALAKQRWQRKPKKWSGWLDERTRIWRGRRVVVDGQVWFAYGCLRNKLIISLDDGQLLGWPGEDDLRWRVVPAHTATVWRDPHAQALGRLKRGTKEKISPAKAKAARINGAGRQPATCNGL